MTPTMSLLLVCGLIAGFTLARLPNRRKFYNLTVPSRRAAILVHLGVCAVLGLFVWFFTVSVGSPLTDYLGVLALLMLESLVAGLLSGFILFGRFSLHIPFSLKEYFREIKVRNGINSEKAPEELTRLETTQRQLPPGMKVIYSSGKGRWTDHDHDRVGDEEPNSRIG